VGEGKVNREARCRDDAVLVFTGVLPMKLATSTGEDDEGEGVAAAGGGEGEGDGCVLMRGGAELPAEARPGLGGWARAVAGCDWGDCEGSEGGRWSGGRGGWAARGGLRGETASFDEEGCRDDSWLPNHEPTKYDEMEFMYVLFCSSI
jgi:hypothetical protein